MSKRYVWEKWNAIISDYTYTGKTTSWRIEYHDSNGGFSSTVYKNGVSFSGGNYNAGDYFQIDSTSATKYYASAAGKATVTSGTHEVGEWYTVTDMAFSAFLYQSRSPVYAKGTTQYANATHSNPENYPDKGGKSGYWYVYLGSDIVDPAKIAYSEVPAAAATVTIEITASTRNTYGGTITYQIQSQTNGGEWEDLTSTSETSYSVVVPGSATAWAVRARAIDDAGFISKDYVYPGAIDAFDFAYDKTTTQGVWDGFGKATQIITASDESFLGAEIPQKIVDYYASANETIENAKTDLAYNLVEKGITANSGESLPDLIAKVLTIKTGGYKCQEFRLESSVAYGTSASKTVYTVPPPDKCFLRIFVHESSTFQNDSMHSAYIINGNSIFYKKSVNGYITSDANSNYVSYDTYSSTNGQLTVTWNEHAHKSTYVLIFYSE